MMGRTHLVITFAAILLFFQNIGNKWIFISVAVLANFIPDIDNAFSYFGNNSGSKIVQLFFKHRGLLHSLTFCIAISLLFSFIFPVLAFPFFLGYSLHLFADSFTKQGITPFWPYRGISKGSIKTGGYKETSIFVFFVVFDLLIIAILLF